MHGPSESTPDNSMQQAGVKLLENMDFGYQLFHKIELALGQLLNAKYGRDKRPDFIASFNTGTLPTRSRLDKHNEYALGLIMGIKKGKLLPNDLAGRLLQKLRKARMARESVRVQQVPQAIVAVEAPTPEDPEELLSVSAVEVTPAARVTGRVAEVRSSVPSLFADPSIEAPRSDARDFATDASKGRHEVSADPLVSSGESVSSTVESAGPVFDPFEVEVDDSNEASGSFNDDIIDLNYLQEYENSSPQGTFGNSDDTNQPAPASERTPWDTASDIDWGVPSFSSPPSSSRPPNPGHGSSIQPAPWSGDSGSTTAVLDDDDDLELDDGSPPPDTQEIRRIMTGDTPLNPSEEIPFAVSGEIPALDTTGDEVEKIRPEGVRLDSDTPYGMIGKHELKKIMEETAVGDFLRKNVGLNVDYALPIGEKEYFSLDDILTHAPLYEDCGKNGMTFTWPSDLDKQKIVPPNPDPRATQRFRTVLPTPKSSRE
jgi:hypothetical protein